MSKLKRRRESLVIYIFTSYACTSARFADFTVSLRTSHVQHPQSWSFHTTPVFFPLFWERVEGRGLAKCDNATATESLSVGESWLTWYLFITCYMNCSLFSRGMMLETWTSPQFDLNFDGNLLPTPSRTLDDWNHLWCILGFVRFISQFVTTIYWLLMLEISILIFHYHNDKSQVIALYFWAEYVQKL